MLAAILRVKDQPLFKAVRLKLNEAHEVVVLSLDVVQESPTRPWREKNQTGPMTAVALKQLLPSLAYLNGLSKPSELGFVFDGRSKSKRSAVAEKVDNWASLAEGMLVFKAGQTSSQDGGRTRRIAFGGISHEAFYVKFNCSSRSKFSGEASDTSSYGTVYTELEKPRRLPRVAQDAKKEANEATVVAPQSYSNDMGVPWHWAESKSSSFWSQFLKDWKAGIVIDLKASTQLPLACLEAGVPYVGFASDQKHLTWLNNVVDLGALKFISKTGHTLYEQELATAVKDLYSDELDADVNEDVLEADSDEDDGA